jgi:predicted ester cyclase
MSEENKTLVRRMIQHLNEGNLDAMDEVFSPELAAIAKEGFAAFRLAFPDWREEIIDIVAEGDKVAARFKCSGTHEGEFMGAPATGKRMEVDEVYFLRVEGGRFVDFWGIEDNLKRLQQLGIGNA